MIKSKRFEKTSGNSLDMLLKSADFYCLLGQPRAALVLYDWALMLAPADPIALAKQTEARRLATDADTARYWKQLVGKSMIKASG